MLVRSSALVAALVVIALTLAACRSGPFGELREVEREQAEAVLTEALRDAEPAADVSEIKIAGRDIWAVAADLVLTAHPDCASVVGSGSSSYEPTEMGAVEGLDNDSPLPAEIAEAWYVWLYGDPDRAHISEQRIVLLWLLPERLSYPVAVATEYVPRTGDESEFDWRRTAEVEAAYCYDAAGEELANFDRDALPPLDLSKLDGHSALDEVALRVRLPGDELCQSDWEAALDTTGLDPNPPDYSGLAEGSDPTPEILLALESGSDDADDFELWYVNAHRALFVSLDDRDRHPTVLGQAVHVLWLGYDAEGVPVWGAEFGGALYLCDEEEDG